MKVGVTTHPKFLRLVRHIRKNEDIGKISPNLIAIGLLEGLWNITSQHCKRGDIGKMSNTDIAEGLHWHGDEDDLVGYLVDSGWIDECEDHRLVIHDWAEHCPTFVKGVISRCPESFAKTRTKSITKCDTKLPTKDIDLVDNLDTKKDELSAILPSQAKSSLSYPSQNQANPSHDNITIAPTETTEMAVVSKPKKTTSKKTIASILIEVRSDAEKFWETNLYPRLGYDGKGDCLSKYARLRNGWSDTSSAKVNPELSHGEIMKACELYGNQFPDPIEKLTWGLKRFMDYDTIKEMLNGNFPHPLGKNKSNLQATQEKILLAYGTDAETFNHGMAIMRGEI